MASSKSRQIERNYYLTEHDPFARSMVSYASSYASCTRCTSSRTVLCARRAARNFGEFFRVHTASPASGYMPRKEAPYRKRTVIAQLFRHDSSHVFRFFCSKILFFFPPKCAHSQPTVPCCSTKPELTKNFFVWCSLRCNRFSAITVCSSDS